MWKKLSLYVTLVVALLASTNAVEQDVAMTGDAPSSIGDRRLSFGFSFSSLMFHLCPPPPPGSKHCHEHNGPLHHHIHCPCSTWYCDRDPSLPVCSSSSTDSSGYDGSGYSDGNADADGGEVAADGNEGNEGEQDTVYDASDNTGGEANSESGVSSGGSWIFSPLAYVILGSAIAGVGLAGALMMRNRHSKAMAGTGVDDTALNPDEGDASAAGGTMAGGGSVFGNMSNRVGMMIGGAALATAGLAGAAAGMFGGRKEDEETEDGLQGSVSRRLDIMENGGDALSAPYYAETRAPSFIDVPHERGENDTVSLSPDAVEVEAPARPSSYAV